MKNIFYTLLFTLLFSNAAYSMTFDCKLTNVTSKESHHEYVYLSKTHAVLIDRKDVPLSDGTYFYPVEYYIKNKIDAADWSSVHGNLFNTLLFKDNILSLTSFVPKKENLIPVLSFDISLDSNVSVVQAYMQPTIEYPNGKWLTYGSGYCTQLN